MVLGEFCRILRIFEAAHSPRGNSMRICYVYTSALAPAAASTTGPDNALALKPDEDRIAPVGMRRANSQNSCRAWRAYVSSRVSTHMFQVLTFRHMTRLSSALRISPNVTMARGYIERIDLAIFTSTLGLVRLGCKRSALSNLENLTFLHTL